MGVLLFHLRVEMVLKMNKKGTPVNVAAIQCNLMKAFRSDQLRSGSQANSRDVFTELAALPPPANKLNIEIRGAGTCSPSTLFRHYFSEQIKLKGLADGGPYVQYYNNVQYNKNV